jgi:small subunit ribosomal protein S6
MELIREYETVFILDPEMEEAGSLTTLIERIEGVITKGGGDLLKADHWGKRKLAYEINKNSRGYYLLENFLGDTKLVKELERNARIMDGVWRFLTLQIADTVDREARVSEAALARDVAAAAAAAAAAEKEEKAAARAEAQAAAAAAAPPAVSEPAAEETPAVEAAATPAEPAEPAAEATDEATDEAAAEPAASDEEKTDG